MFFFFVLEASLGVFYKDTKDLIGKYLFKSCEAFCWYLHFLCVFCGRWTVYSPQSNFFFTPKVQQVVFLTCWKLGVTISPIRLWMVVLPQTLKVWGGWSFCPVSHFFYPANLSHLKLPSLEKVSKLCVFKGIKNPEEVCSVFTFFPQNQQCYLTGVADCAHVFFEWT